MMAPCPLERYPVTHRAYPIVDRDGQDSVAPDPPLSSFVHARVPTAATDPNPVFARKIKNRRTRRSLSYEVASAPDEPSFNGRFNNTVVCTTWNKLEMT
jgi:hypothetical protein